MMSTPKSVLTDFFLKHKGVTALLFFMTLLSNASFILIPILIGKYYDILFGYHTFRARLLEWAGLDLPQNLERVILVLGAVILIYTLSSFGVRILTRYLGERVALEIRKKIFASLLDAPLRLFDRKPVGKFLSGFTGDIKSIQNLVTQGIIRWVSDLVFILIILVTLASLHLKWTLLLISSAPILFAATVLFNRPLKTAGKKSRATQGRMLAFVTSRLQAIVSVKVFNRQALEERKLGKMTFKLLRRRMKFHLIDGLIHSCIVGMLYLFLLALLTFAAGHLPEGGTQEISGGLLIAYITLLLTALPFFKRGLKVNAVRQKASLSFERIVALLNQETESGSRKEPLILRAGTIEFKHVSFGYRSGETVLYDFSCIFEKGKLTRIVGRNGSGKSTILKLILGLYIPQRGMITIDGEDLSRFDPKSIRQDVTLVSPEAPLLGRSVMEAVADVPGPSQREKVLSVFRQFKLGPVLNQAMDPDYKIGEMGKKLSNGQKMTLMLVRAFMADKKILLLDEPFIGLDEQMRENLWEMLKAMKGPKTLILVDHHADDEVEIDHTVILARTELAVTPIPFA